jgi:butyrate kinase
MSGPHRILVINPGSTTTKLALFVDDDCRAEKTLEHTTGELRPFTDVAEQEGFRTELALAFLNEVGGAEGLLAVVGRGGLLRPLEGGTWLVSPAMIDELRRAGNGEHASNLGALMASGIAAAAGCPAFIVDPVVVDELVDEARLTGIPAIERRSIFHALSQKAAARLACRDLGLDYADAHLVVAHLGGGISVGAHREGRVVDVNNALDGEGPMAPERCGAVPVRDLVSLCFDGDHTRRELNRAISGTSSLKELEARRSEEPVRRVLDAFAYGIARAITGSFAALCRVPQAIVLTGGAAKSRWLVTEIERRVAFAAPIKVYAENLEMAALAGGALRVLREEESAREYPPITSDGGR